jgi:hypothetical protein
MFTSLQFKEHSMPEARLASFDSNQFTTKKYLSILKNSFPLFFHIVKLSTVDRPPDAADDKKHQDDRQGHQKIQNIHQDFRSNRASFDSRNALRTTSRELQAMPNPANHAGSKPKTASGTQTAL